MENLSEPCKANHYQQDHIRILMRSFKHWLGKEWVVPTANPGSSAEYLYQAPFVVLSHNRANDPIFNYANRQAQALFEYSWETFVQTPSRQSAEPVSQAERSALLARVNTYGFIDDYQGIRISASGQKFWIEDAIIWNLLDDAGQYDGQAACIRHWRLINA